MNPKNDEDWLDETIARAADIGKVELDRAKLLDRLEAERRESREACPRVHRAAFRRKIWRTVMDSKITRYSAAATILVAASVILMDPFGLSGGRNGVVLAEAAQKTSEAQTVIHRERRLAYRPGEDEPFRQVEVKKYVSSDFGIVEEQYDPNGMLMHRGYFLQDQQKIIIVFPSARKYVEMPARGGFYDELAKMMAPGGLVNYFVSREYTKLGRSRFGDFEVEGFETSDIDLFPIPDQLRFIFPVDDLSGRLWIDVETSMPVGIEMELTVGRGLMTGFRKLRGVFTAYDFHWNAEIPEGIFEPNIPEDYTPMNLESITKENNAWIGFRVLPLAGIFILRRRQRRSQRRGPA